MAANEDPYTTTIIICNHQAQKQILELHKVMHPILNIPPSQIQYNLVVQIFFLK